MKHLHQILVALVGTLPFLGMAVDPVQPSAPSVPPAVTKPAGAPAPAAKEPVAKPAAAPAVPKTEAPAPAAKEPVAKPAAAPAAPKTEAPAPVAKEPVAKPADTNAAPKTEAPAPAPKAEGTNTTAKVAAVAPVDGPSTDQPVADDAGSSDTNSVPSAAEKPEDPRFARYKTILDRMPFGPEPDGFDPDSGGSSGRGGIGPNGEMTPEAEAAAIQAAAEQMLQGVRISALNVTPRGSIAVGFTDSSKQPAASYYMKVGETRDGWTVKAADAREMTVTLERDGVEGTLKLGEGADPNAKGGKGAAGARPGAPNAVPNRGGLMLGGRAGLAAGGANGFTGRPSWGAGRPGFGGLRPGMPTANAGAAAGAAPNETASDALARLRQRRLQKEADRQAESARQAAAAEQAKAEREKAAAEREKAAAEREQQRQTLIQIQEELRRQREAREQQQQNGADGNNGANAPAAPATTPGE